MQVRPKSNRCTAICQHDWTRYDTLQKDLRPSNGCSSSRSNLCYDTAGRHDAHHPLVPRRDISRARWLVPAHGDGPALKCLLRRVVQLQAVGVCVRRLFGGNDNPPRTQSGRNPLVSLVRDDRDEDLATLCPARSCVGASEAGRRHDYFGSDLMPVN